MFHQLNVDVVVCFRLAELGQEVGIRMLDILAVRERGSRRETRLLNILLFIKGPLWKVKSFPADVTGKYNTVDR